MMFNNRFVFAIRVGGKVLREQNGTVALPFGAEYDLILKNLNSRRAMANVTVDGKAATENTRLIIPANGSINLERYIRNGNLNSGNRFKFIERTAQIEAHRGIGADDGLIRAEFWAERERISLPVYYQQEERGWPSIPKHPTSPRFGEGFLKSRRMSKTPMRSSGPQSASGGFRSFSGITGQSMGSSGDATSFCNASASLGDEPELITGITVPGSASNQQFQYVSGFELETTSTVIVLQLRGQIQGEPVYAPVTVEYKPQCPTCGRINKATSRYCSTCGTALQLI